MKFKETRPWMKNAYYYKILKAEFPWKGDTNPRYWRPSRKDMIRIQKGREYNRLKSQSGKVIIRVYVFSFPFSLPFPF